jgi:hypothetical protein
MQNIIDTLKNAILSNNPLIDSLNENSSLYWKENYPIKIVHEENRVKENEILSYLKSINFFNKNGFSPSKYTDELIELLNKKAPNYIQHSTLAVLKNDLNKKYSFKEKFIHDRWKKVVNDNDLQAIVEVSSFDSSKTICEIEIELRDIMRSRKEVPSLKPIGFIWLAKVQKSTDITKILKHYFADNFIKVVKNDEINYIGWNKELQKINMRYFVCIPNNVS